MKTKTGKILFSITLSAEDYEALEEMCKMERRSKSRQIAWIFRVYRDSKIKHYIPTPTKAQFEKTQILLSYLRDLSDETAEKVLNYTKMQKTINPACSTNGNNIIPFSILK